MQLSLRLVSKEVGLNVFGKEYPEGVVVEEAHNQLGPVAQEEGTLCSVLLEPTNIINYSGPKNTCQSLEESASGPDFIREGLRMLTTQFRFQTNLKKQCSGVKEIRKH
ncbi:hypothetical protein Ancab_017002 [Ancistrocladus abbreviatus]